MKRAFSYIACLICLGLRSQNPEVSKQDREFVACAAMDNLMEIRLSELAGRKGFSPEVKELAIHLSDDHKKTDALLKQLASARSLTVATELDEEHQKELKKLDDKEGEDFDKCFTDYIVKSHKKAIKEYEKEADKGDNTELRAFANNTLTSMNHHKNLADATCEKLKKKN